MPQLAVAYIGAEIGGAVLGTEVFALGLTGAQIGMAAGSLIGGMLFAPTQKSQGPRLADLKAAQVTYGSVIPFVEGHPRMAGVIVWASIKREDPNTTSSGKGGGGSQSTTYTYEQDIMFMLSENIVGGVRKIWRNGELIWTAANDGDAASVANTSELWTRMTFYSGAADQLPDPTYEAAVGAGNAPAYRTRSCLFFEGLKLGTSGELANYTFELVPAGGNINPSIFDAPLATDVLDIDAPLAADVVTHSAGVTFASAWAQLAGVAGTGNPAVTYTADKFTPPSVRPIRYEFQFKDPVKITAPTYTFGFHCSNEDFVVAEALAAYNAANYGGWVVAAGYPTYDGMGVPLKLKFTRTYTGTIDMWRVPHFYASGPSDDYGILADPDYPYEYCATGEEAAAKGAQYLALWHAGREAIYLFTEHGAGTIRIGHYTFQDVGGGNASENTEQLNWHAWTNYTEHSVEFDFTPCTPTVFDPPNNGPYQMVFTATEGGDSVGFGFIVVSDVVHLAASINGVDTDLGVWTPPGSGFSDVQIEINGTASGSVQIYVDSVLMISGTSATSFGTMALHGFGVNDVSLAPSASGISSWKVRDLTVTMGAVGTSGLTEPTLQEVVERQCVRAGLTLDQVDASALATRTVRAMAVTQITSPRQVVEILLSAYGAQVVESEVLRFSWRGGAAVATIPFEALVDRGAGNPLPITKLNDVERPCQVFVKYSNVYDDYQDGTESSDRLVSSSQNTTLVEYALGFTPLEAKRIADFQVIDAASAIFQFGPFGLTRDYAALEPTDVVTLTGQDGKLFRVRLGKKDEAGGVLTFEGVSEEASVTVATSVARTSSGGYTNSTGIKLPVDTLAQLLDIPILADRDDNPGFYAVVKAATDVSFPGAVLFESLDDVTFSSVGSTEQAGTFGIATTTLGNGVTGVFDEVNSLTVDVGFGQLYSYSRSDILNGVAPAYLVGAEVFFARTATLVSAGVYTLSGLLRGRRGTEWAVGAHGAAEAFVVLDAAVKRVPMNNADIGVARWWKAVTSGRSAATATAASFTDTAVGKKPFSPVDLRVARDGSGNATITLQRRSRMSTRLIGVTGVSCPLGEDSEAYQVDVYATSGYATLKRTLSVTGSASLAYTAAQQTTDFGSAQSTLYVKAYQMSASVGRGYPLTTHG